MLSTSSSTEVRGRFAPSPSGRMHLGNVFCALIAWLCARAGNGKIVLRIEDLDPQRSKAQYISFLEDDLQWLGLDWDEGGSGGGTYSPYFQSRRNDIYIYYFKKLSCQNRLYPCFCSRGERLSASAPHGSDNPAVYPGRCRSLPDAVIERLKEEKPYSFRICVPDETVSFCDLNYGYYEENLPASCGDFIVRRSDGVYAYQLAVTVDDALMGITHVVRGADLLPSTARQIFLFRALGFAPPVYGHVPLLVAPDGRRLAKRDRDLDLGCLRALKKTPEEIIGRLAFLSGFVDHYEKLKARDLIPLFSWDRIPRENIVLDPSLFR